MAPSWIIKNTNAAWLCFCSTANGLHDVFSVEALAGEMDAVVTAPIHKKPLRASGCPHPGHTELLASLTGALQVAMMLVAGSLRVSHVTTHLALRQACERVRQERVLQVIRLTHQAVVRMGVRRPHIVVAGLNPHAGEPGGAGQADRRGRPLPAGHGLLPGKAGGRAGPAANGRGGGDVA